MKKIVKILGVVLAAVTFVFLSGCASTEMKGTPFYTGEYNKRKGPAEDRVNVWPLMYYRDPALSVLWPAVEFTDDHFAIRPLMSIYGLGDEKKVYNVLWPIGQFNRKSGNNRIFPVFWGKDYFTAFPLYWHYDHPFGKRGYDGLIPLWSYYRSDNGFSLYLPWPIGHLKRTTTENGWHVWPLAGNYSHKDGYYRFMFWPLGHQWSDMDGKERGDTFIPLYYREKDQNSSVFFSLPWWYGREADGSSWQLMPPLFYHSSDPKESRFLSLIYSRGESASGSNAWSLLLPLYYSERTASERLWASVLGGFKSAGEDSSWFVTPLLTGGSSGHEKGSVWALGPIAHSRWDRDSSSHHVFPLYYHSSGKDGSRFVSVPWSSGSDARGNSWQLCPLLYFREKSEKRNVLMTPLYSQGDSDGGKTQWRTTVPLFYERETATDKLFATLVGGYHSDAQGKNWLIYPLLSGGRRTDTGGDVWLVAPLLHAQWDKDYFSHHVLPLYYWNGKDKTFVSPLAAKWGDDNGKRYTAVPPLLSMYETDGKSSSLWSVGGLARYSWGSDPASSYLLPLFYSEPHDGTFVSPLFAKWQTDDARTSYLIPPMLSWLTKGDKSSDLWVGGPLAHFGFGEHAGKQHIFPLYYRDSSEGTFVSLPFMKYKDGNRTTGIIPPLLSGYSTDGTDMDITALLGLFQNNWEPDPAKRDGYLFPLYYYDNKKFYTPLVGWNNETDGFFYPLTPFVGVKKGSHSGGWLFPLFSHDRDKSSGNVDGTFLWGRYWRHGSRSSSWIFPIYGYWNDGSPDYTSSSKYGEYGKTFISLPAFWYRNTTSLQGVRDGKAVAVNRKEQVFFPLWTYNKREEPGANRENVDGSLLLALYDYKRDVKPRDKGQEGKDEYARARILWHLWHYERSNNDVSVDIFPAITYDRKSDKFKKVSFLWRFFRYERNETGKKLDLLFVPLARTGTK